MIDNLQRFYLGQLEDAKESALHGNHTFCLNICVSETQSVSSEKGSVVAGELQIM
jgi:hypothetical protein